MTEQEFITKWNMVPLGATGCRLWTGRCDKDGYGIVDYDRNPEGKLMPTRVARLIYRLKVGSIPDGMVIKHSCDNPSCVALEHLELGTYSENNQEGYDKGRHIPVDVSGTSNPNCRLSEFDILSIKLSNEPYEILAAKFGMSLSLLDKIKRGVLWDHITAEDVAEIGKISGVPAVVIARMFLVTPRRVKRIKRKVM